MNPILSREIRARFRDKRSFWLLFGVCALLCLAATFIYASATSLVDYSGVYGSNLNRQSENRTGRELFRFLALGNLLAWLLIAPALTATGLAKEREQGLLESLWLSPFQVRAQIWGRLGAALCFLLLLQVAVLPIYGIAALLGGVSPFDIAMSGLLIGMGALTTAAFGLFCSARSYRGSSALGAAFFGVVLWSVVAFFYAQQLIWFPTAVNFLWFPIGLNSLVTFSHPVALLWLLLSPDDFAPRFGGLTTISTPDALTFGLVFQLISSLLLIWAATRKASKPLPDMNWSQGNKRIRTWRDELNAAKKERQLRRETERAGQKVAGALLYEVPVEKFVRFKDPLLSREVRGRFRLRQSGTLVSLLRFATFVVAVGFWLFVAFNALDKVSRSNAGLTLMLALWGFGALAVGVMSSGALVREREAGTWEGLHLSLLSPWEIVRSKWLSPLITFAYWSVPGWILLPLCVPFEAMSALFIVVASLSSVSAWGFYVSSRAPHSAAATSWTLATLLVALVALPSLDEILGIKISAARYFFPAAAPYQNYGAPFGNYQSIWLPFEAVWNSYHPFISIGNLFSRTPFDSGTTMKIVALNLAFNALLTTVLLWQVWRRLRKTEV